MRRRHRTGSPGRAAGTPSGPPESSPALGRPNAPGGLQHVHVPHSPGSATAWTWSGGKLTQILDRARIAHVKEY